MAVAFAALQLIRSEIGSVDVAGPTLSPASTTQTTASVAPPPATEGENAIAFSAPELAAEPLKPRAEAEPLADAAPVVTASTSPTATPASPSTDAAAPARVQTTIAAPPTVPPALPAEVGPEDLRKAALSGDAAAQFEVAMRYSEGRGVPADPNAAVEWYERAAANGLPVAQYRLGSIYENGMGVPKDLAKAQDWYRRGSDAGNIKSMHNLAVLYAEGAGGDPDLTSAVKLFRRAAEYGVRDLQFNIAVLHARGLGVPQDLIEAYKWFAVAATLGDAESVKRRDAIAATMSPEDLAKGKAAAEAFEPLIADPAANEVPPSEWGPASTSAISLGPQADLTAHVQELLAAKGFDPGPADGMAGQKTRDAIVEFQKGAGLPPTGEIDPALVQALEGSST